MELSDNQMRILARELAYWCYRGRVAGIEYGRSKAKGLGDLSLTKLKRQMRVSRSRIMIDPWLRKADLVWRKIRAAH